MVRKSVEGAVCINDTKDGFSTIELLSCLALMGIIAAIALPNWRGLFPSYALNNSTRQIQSELHHLKMRAAAENIGFQLAYLPGTNQYTIYRDSQALVTKPLAEGTSFTKAGTITFSPRGTAGANRVRLSNADGKCQQIVVSATGRVRVCTPDSCSSDC
jgi:prepilin-type N-terminal cleavage/methylation domain-containing protein